MTIAMPSLPKALDPTQLRLANHFLLLQCFCQTLVRTNEQGDMVSDAAESWTFSDQARTVTFKLKPDLKFPDGSKLTAADFANSLSRHFTPQTKSAVGGYLKKIAAEKEPFTAVDAQTLKIRLRHSYGPLLHLLAMPGFCALKESKSTVGGFMGSGPLAVEELTESTIRFHRNLNYKGNVEINDIVVQAIPALNESLSRVDWDKIDIAIGIPPEMLETQNIPGFVATPLESLAIAHLYFNTEKRPDLDPQLRRLISTQLSTLKSEFKGKFYEPIGGAYVEGRSAAQVVSMVCWFRYSIASPIDERMSRLTNKVYRF